MLPVEPVKSMPVRAGASRFMLVRNGVERLSFSSMGMSTALDVAFMSVQDTPPMAPPGAVTVRLRSVAVRPGSR